MSLQARAQAAERAARQAGEMLRHHGRLQIREKAANDFVTEMDERSEKLLRETLLSQFPEDGFFGEEGGGDENVRGR